MIAQRLAFIFIGCGDWGLVYTVSVFEKAFDFTSAPSTHQPFVPLGFDVLQNRPLLRLRLYEVARRLRVPKLNTLAFERRIGSRARLVLSWYTIWAQIFPTSDSPLNCLPSDMRS